MKAPKAITVSIFGPKQESDASPAATSLTVEQLNEALKPHGWHLPADPLAVNDFGYVSATLGEIFALTAVCLAFVAYARLTPAPPDAS